MALTETNDLEQLAQDYADRASRTTDPELRSQILMALATLLHERFSDTEQAVRVLLEALYETPADVHVETRNSSASKPAKFLVFFVKRQDAPPVLPVTSK